MGSKKNGDTSYERGNDGGREDDVLFMIFLSLPLFGL
jgi:hypothetical protein